MKTEKVLKLIEERKITIRKAAELAGVSYIEMYDLISQAGIDIGYSLDDLKKDIRD